MLKIGKPYLEDHGDKVRLCAKLEFPMMERVAWFETDKEYAGYFTVDRADAFVTAFLTPAMKAGEDIVSEAPVTKRLLYQLNRRLIPTLSAHTKRYHSMQIQAEPTEVLLPCEQAVGLAWTGGVDSFYSFKRYEENEEPDVKVTHLVVLNIGTFEDGNLEEDLAIFLERAREMAEEYGMKAMGINSNIQCIVEENYLSVGAFRIPAGILAFQKLFGTFLHSSSRENWRFELLEEESTFYEWFVFDCLETDHTKIYSAMGDVSRGKKLKALADYPPAWKRLHPCIHVPAKNCGTCTKCKTNFIPLYALGKLDLFSAVVDTEQIKRDMDQNLSDIAAKFPAGELFELLDENGMFTPRQKRLARVMRRAIVLSEEQPGGEKDE